MFKRIAILLSILISMLVVNVVRAGDLLAENRAVMVAAVNACNTVHVNELLAGPYVSVNDPLVFGQNEATYGRSYLLLAMLSHCPDDKHIATVKALLNAGADANSGFQAQPLAVAIATMGPYAAEAIDALIAAGADPNGSTSAGPPLFVAARWPIAIGSGPTTGNSMRTLTIDEERAVIHALVKGGADVNFRLSNGFTPLLVAALFKSDIRVLDALIANGADLHAVTADGWNAADLAIVTYINNHCYQPGAYSTPPSGAGIGIAIVLQENRGLTLHTHPPMFDCIHQ